MLSPGATLAEPTCITTALGSGVRVKVRVGVDVGVEVKPCVGVGVGVRVEVAVAVGVDVAVEVNVAVGVDVAVEVAVAVGVDVAVGVGVSVEGAVAVGVGVSVEVNVAVGVDVAVEVAVGVGVVSRTISPLSSVTGIAVPEGSVTATATRVSGVISPTAPTAWKVMSARITSPATPANETTLKRTMSGFTPS